MSEGCKRNPKNVKKISTNKYPELSIQTAKCFPDDFFGDDVKIHKRNSQRYVTSSGIEKRSEEFKGEVKFNFPQNQTENKEDHIQEIIVEPDLKVQYDSRLSHRNKSKITELDFFDEPSTSGSYQGANQLSNVNSPNCLGNISSSYYYCPDNEKQNEDENPLFKETAHFFRCQTEANVPRQEIKKHSNVKSAIPKSIRSKSKKVQPDRKSSAKSCKLEENYLEKPTPKNKRNSVQADRPKSSLSMQNTRLPVIGNPQVFTKELENLFDNVPKEYIEDPEIKKGLNILLQNLNDFKEVIHNKKSTHDKRSSNHPTQSYKRVLNKNLNNKPIKIVNTINRKKSIHY